MKVRGWASQHHKISLKNVRYEPNQTPGHWNLFLKFFWHLNQSKGFQAYFLPC